MDWNAYLEDYLINCTSKYTNERAYNISHQSAIISAENGKLLASSKNFGVFY